MSNFNFDGHKLFYQFDTTYKLLTDQSLYPVYVEISPVGHCNHRCLFCAYDYIGYNLRQLDKENTIQAIKDLGVLGTKAILFAGEGEPLLHKNIDSFISAAYDNKIDSAIYTNGVLLTPELSDEILKKLTFIRISFNGGNKEAYNQVHQKDDFEKVITNIQYAVEHKKKYNLNIDIGLQIVVIHETLDSIIELAKLGKDLQVDYLAIKPFYQHPNQIGYHFPENFSLDSLDQILTEAENFSTSNYKVIARRDSFVKYHHRNYEHCYSLPLFSVILSDGNVYSCLSNLGNDDYCFGNINDMTIKGIMDSDKRKQILDFAKNKMDCQKDCIPNCRLDSINRSLWELKHPTIKHINFI